MIATTKARAYRQRAPLVTTRQAHALIVRIVSMLTTLERRR
ncbi:MAG: hypothetical protein AB7O37_07985 [Vicinamibacteria bacterium]